MTRLGKLSTNKKIDQGIEEIRNWLDKIQVSGLTIDARYDPRTNVALLRFQHKGQNYEFRSTKQANCRLNMWAIARAMESKVRNHIMGIETFEKSMKAYLMIEGSTEPSAQPTEQDLSAYATLGISNLCSNDELLARYKTMAKSYHPDMAGSQEAKKVFEQKFSEINSAFAKIKAERGLQ